MRKYAIYIYIHIHPYLRILRWFGDVSRVGSPHENNDYHILSLLFIVQHIQPAAALITGGLGPEPWPNLAGWMAGSRASRPRGSPIEPAPVQAGQRRSWSTWKEAYNPNGGGVRWGYHGIPKLVPYGAIWCHRVDPKMVDPSRPEQLWFFGIYLGTIWCHIAGKWSLSGGIQEASQFPPAAPSGTGTSGHSPGSGSPRGTPGYIGHISSMSSIFIIQSSQVPSVFLQPQCLKGK